MKGTTIWHHKAASLLEWAACGKAGDAYYRAMGVWLNSRQTIGSAQSVYDVAMVYESALQNYLVCINGLPISAEVERDVTKGRQYQSYLARDIEFLFPMIAAKKISLIEID